MITEFFDQTRADTLLVRIAVSAEVQAYMSERMPKMELTPRGAWASLRAAFGASMYLCIRECIKRGSNVQRIVYQKWFTS